MAACTKKQRVDECIDRIRNLPECLILRILSCLPTKDAMHTSVLSKKWINLWTLISSLHFDDSGFSPPKRRKGSFVKFVNRVLLHHPNSTFQSFKLIALECYDTHQCYVDAWITAALNHQVQKLHIDYMWSTNISPHSLFQCQSLVELKLELPMCQLRILASVCLPNLKFLSLSRISLKSYSSFPSWSDSSTLTEEVTLGFPVLRVLKSKRCGWLMQNVCLHVPLLERLVFSVSNLDFFRLKSFGRTFKICNSRPKVFAFKIEDGYHHLKGIVKDIVLSDPSSSSEATLEISGKGNFDKVRISSPVCMLLKQFNQMRYLKLGNIQVLSEFDKMVLDSASPPHCAVSSLKVVKFGVLDGKKHELCLAKFLMENGAVLEQVSFSLSQTLQNGSSKTALEEIKRQLLSFGKCSGSVQVSVL